MTTFSIIKFSLSYMIILFSLIKHIFYFFFFFSLFNIFFIHPLQFDPLFFDSYQLNIWNSDIFSAENIYIVILPNIILFSKKKKRKRKISILEISNNLFIHLLAFVWSFRPVLRLFLFKLKIILGRAYIERTTFIINVVRITGWLMHSCCIY